MTETQNTDSVGLPPNAPPANDGHTVAAWTTVIGVLLGVTVAAVGIVVPAVWLCWVGAGVAIAGLVAGGALRQAGLGQRRPTS